MKSSLSLSFLLESPQTQVHLGLLESLRARLNRKKSPLRETQSKKRYAEACTMTHAQYRSSSLKRIADFESHWN